MLLARGVLAHNQHYRWLVWNLFLAWVPYIAALALTFTPRRPAWVTGGLWGVWLLFLPNAPYLVTDLIHLTWVETFNIYYDIAMVGFLAYLGLMLGFAAMQVVHGMVARARGALWGWIFAVGVWWLSALGIYLGRVPRWNSWNVLRAPLAISRDALWLLTQREPQLFIVIFGLILNLGYFIYWQSGRAHSDHSTLAPGRTKVN
jgi:uncharacterized membrane protein